jgi:thioredoxin-like negative regulator of GroEL
VSWRHDYAAARREAAEKGRALLIDLGTENCVWCKELDARTFKDPGVVALLNDRCVPVKVDAQRDARLAAALRVRSYPTLVVAHPDGRILVYQEGFVDAARFKELMQRALAPVAAPDWMQRDYDEAVKAHAAGRIPQAVSLLKNVLEDGKDRPVQAKARQLLLTIEKQAAEQYARARQLADKGQTNEAKEKADALARDYAGTQSARDAGRLVGTLVSRPLGGDQRARRAHDLLAQAREDYRTQQFLCCLDRCELLVATFADLPEGTEAGRLLAEIKSNSEWAKQACEQLTDRLSVLYLALAESWLKKGQPQQAVFYLERVIQTFPNSRQAEIAQVRLSQIQGQPAGKK